MTAYKRRAPAEYVDALRKRKFEIDDFIGNGAYGYVWRAIQLSLNRPVAIKFFDGIGMRDESNRKRFERERLLLARLDHPAIPYILTDGALFRGKEEIPYIVMQFISGTKLSDIIDRQRKLEVGDAIRITQNILSALACAHRGNVVHRDVAPDNIIVSEQVTYLFDFSIGICTEHVPGLTRTTDPGERVGRSAYASPEQMVDSSSVDHRTDIYSAGVVLYELLTGHPRIKTNLIDQDLSHVPVELRTAIRTACAPKRDERFPNAEAFIDALQRLSVALTTLSGEPTLSLCPNWKCPGAHWSERGYFRGPRINDECADPYCNACGTRYIKNCRACRSPLPLNLKQLVVTSHKSDRDATEAHCSRCGELIFQTPACATCRSFLTLPDMGTDTKTNGCSKCRAPQPSPYGDDDGIPF